MCNELLMLLIAMRDEVLSLSSFLSRDVSILFYLLYFRIDQ